MSFDHWPIDYVPIDSAGCAEAVIAPLVRGHGTLKDEDAWVSPLHRLLVLLIERRRKSDHSSR